MTDANDIARKNGTDALRVVIDNEADVRPPAFSDDALATRFAEQHENRLRYVAAWNQWLEWDGRRWLPDKTLLASHLVRRCCRKVAKECNSKPKISVAIASAKTAFAVERLTRSDRKFAATTEQWDTDEWLLNTPAGVIDLRTGKRRVHRQLDYMTKMTGVAPDGSCSIETWIKFLERVTGGDGDLIGFIQRMAGYALTGSTRDHALFFCYGTGANGKSTLLNALTGCIGDYHRASPIETFTASATERHPTDLAGLRGARLVTSVETEEGRRWAESKIKALTGGDKIAARLMRQDFFEFIPSFKLIIAGNHKPGLRSVDEAIRRRFHLLPFVVTIAAAERDETLSEKLKAEWPGILAWMIQGCLDWQARGLAAPEVVQAATSAYMEAEDTFAAWFDECAVRDNGSFETTGDLWASWDSYAKRVGEFPGSAKKFSQRLEDQGAAIGVRRHRTETHRGFLGLRLIRPDLASASE
jgi:putative DNA primase/helicase